MRIPVRRSWRNELIRAICTRMSRYDSRTPLRNIPETITTKGMTANEARATPVHDQHCYADGDEREEVAEPGNHTRGKELIEGFYIRCHPRDEPPDRIAIKIGDREALKVAKNLHPEIAHHPLAEQARQPRLAIRGDELDDQREKEQPGANRDDPNVARGHGDVDYPAGEQRSDDLDSSLDAEQRKRAVHQRSVRSRINKQTTHQLAIVCFAED